MKLKYIALTAMAVALCSCSEAGEEPVAVDDNGQQIAFRISATGDKESRGGRLITSSEAAEDVDAVCLAIYSLNPDSTIDRNVFVRNFAWKDSTANLGEGEMVHLNLRKVPELSGTKGLPDGKYMIVAAGYTADSDMELKPGADALTASDPIMNAFVPDGKTPDEIFAGGIPVVEVKDSKFVPSETDGGIMTVTLRRQIAGTFGYFSNIPSRGFDGTPASHIRLVASGKNNLLRLAGFNNSGLTLSVMNGAMEGKVTADATFADGRAAYTVYETSIADWFPNGDVNSDGILNASDADHNGMSGNWKVPGYLDGKISILRGTVFCSSFIVPFLTDGGHPTFELQLIAKTGSGSPVILRRWSANSPQMQTDVMTVGPDGSLLPAESSETATSYSVLRNHLYTIGRKSLAFPGGEGDTPVEPGIDDDPEDLSKGEIVVISVNSHWEEHHRLIIKPQL